MKIADYVTKKYDTKVEVLTNITGLQTEVHWVSKKGSLGEFEELRAKLSSDPEYNKILGESEGLFVDGTFRDHFYRVR